MSSRSTWVEPGEGEGLSGSSAGGVTLSGGLIGTDRSGLICGGGHVLGWLYGAAHPLPCNVIRGCRGVQTARPMFVTYTPRPFRNVRTGVHLGPADAVGRS